MHVVLSFCLAQPGELDGSVTINEKNIRLDVVLDMIKSQTDLDFSYNPNSIDPSTIVSLSAKETPVEKVISSLCKKLRANYSIIDNTVILVPKKESETQEEEKLTISGFISDKESGEVLIGATVSLKGTNRGVITNEFGYYSLPLKAGYYSLVYSYIGYEQLGLIETLTKSIKKDVELELGAIDLPDVIVDQPLSNKLDKKELSEVGLSSKAFASMPEFGGETNLFTSIQSLPGVSMNSDGSAFFYVRGGGKDQNVIIIDDAPIYNPSHLFGMYSTIIPEFVKSITVHKSDMPANLGDRLSSIVSIRTRDGSLNKFHFGGSINPLIYRFSFEIPTIKKRGSILLSFRRSNFEWLYRRDSPDTKANFGDLNFKWNHKFNDKNRLYLTTIWGTDNYLDTSPSTGASGIRWANLAATLRWNHIFGPKLFSNTTLYTGNYVYRLQFSPDFWQSSISSLSLKTDFTHYTSQTITSKFGLEAQSYFINPGEITIDSSIAILPNISSNFSRKLVGYYQGIYDLNDKWRLKAGLRLTSWANRGETTYYTFDQSNEVQDTINTTGGVYNNYQRIDPRISLQFQVDSFSRVKLSYGNYHQYLQLISNTGSPFMTMEVWLPASPNIKPQGATQVDLSYLRFFEKPDLEFSAAIFYKHFRNQIDYTPHALTLINPLIEGELRFGDMRSYGLELFLRKNTGRLNGWVSYTYSRTNRNTPDLNDGETYPAFQDKPHEFSVFLNYRLGRRTHFSGYYTIFSGARFSSPTGFYSFNNQTVPIYDSMKNDRLPTYQRFDVAFNFILNKREDAKFQNSLALSVYNVFAHKNIVKVNFNKIPVEGDRPIVPANFYVQRNLIASQADLIRFFPSITYKFKI